MEEKTNKFRFNWFWGFLGLLGFLGYILVEPMYYVFFCSFYSSWNQLKSRKFK